MLLKKLISSANIGLIAIALLSFVACSANDSIIQTKQNNSSYYTQITTWPRAKLFDRFSTINWNSMDNRRGAIERFEKEIALTQSNLSEEKGEFILSLSNVLSSFDSESSRKVLITGLTVIYSDNIARSISQGGDAALQRLVNAFNATKSRIGKQNITKTLSHFIEQKGDDKQNRSQHESIAKLVLLISRDKDPFVRKASVPILAKIGTIASKKRLKAMAEEDPYHPGNYYLVREAAKKALQQ